MKILFFIGVFCTFHAFAQVSAEKVVNQKTTLGERGLNRFFLDWVIGAGLMRDHSVDPQNKFGIILDFRIGNNFYLGKGNNPFIVRITYLRVGFVGERWGISTNFIPPQLGLAKHFKLNEMVSIEPGIHVGYIFTSEVPFNGISKFGFGVIYEIKFNVGKFSMGIEYGTRKDSQTHSSTYYNSYERYHYFGFSLGTRIGKDL